MMVRGVSIVFSRMTDDYFQMSYRIRVLAGSLTIMERRREHVSLIKSMQIGSDLNPLAHQRK